MINCLRHIGIAMFETKKTVGVFLRRPVLFGYALISLLFFTTSIHAQRWLAIGPFSTQKKTTNTFNSFLGQFAEKNNVSNSSIESKAIGENGLSPTINCPLNTTICLVGTTSYTQSGVSL